MKINDCVCYFERQSADDYKFTVGGVTYYVDAKVKEENYFLVVFCFAINFDGIVIHFEDTGRRKVVQLFSGEKLIFIIH